MPARSCTAAPQTIDLGDGAAPLLVRVNRRARRLIVSVDAVAGRVIVTAPTKREIPEALDFARTRTRWIRGLLANAGGPKPFRDGGSFPLQGMIVTVMKSGGPRAAVRLIGDRLHVGGDEAHFNRRVVDFLKAEIRRTITPRVDHYAGVLGRKRGPIAIRDMRTRWGSCGRDGAMSFSWRLILAPPFVLDCVAAHECAHLVHLDHSPAFWRVVKDLGVDPRAARDWFRRNGATLHAYGVEV